jgi:hypothetical protein
MVNGRLPERVSGSHPTGGQQAAQGPFSLDDWQVAGHCLKFASNADCSNFPKNRG